MSAWWRWCWLTCWLISAASRTSISRTPTIAGRPTPNMMGASASLTALVSVCGSCRSVQGHANRRPARPCGTRTSGRSTPGTSWRRPTTAPCLDWPHKSSSAAATARGTCRTVPPAAKRGHRTTPDHSAISVSRQPLSKSTSSSFSGHCFIGRHPPSGLSPYTAPSETSRRNPSTRPRPAPTRSTRHRRARCRTRPAGPQPRRPNTPAPAR